MNHPYYQQFYSGSPAKYFLMDDIEWIEQQQQNRQQITTPQRRVVKDAVDAMSGSIAGSDLMSDAPGGTAERAVRREQTHPTSARTEVNPPVDNLADKFTAASWQSSPMAPIGTIVPADQMGDRFGSTLRQERAAAMEPGKVMRLALDAERLLKSQLADELVAAQGSGGTADSAFCSIWNAIQDVAEDRRELIAHLARTLLPRSVVGPAFIIYSADRTANLETLLGIERRRRGAAAWSIQQLAELTQLPGEAVLAYRDRLAAAVATAKAHKCTVGDVPASMILSRAAAGLRREIEMHPLQLLQLAANSNEDIMLKLREVSTGGLRPATAVQLLGTDEVWALLCAAEASHSIADVPMPPTRNVQAPLPLAATTTEPPTVMPAVPYATQPLLAAIEQLTLTVAAIAAEKKTNGSSQTAEKRGPPRPRACFNCGAEDHIQRVCPTKVCPRCQEKGHGSSVCTAPAPIPKKA